MGHRDVISHLLNQATPQPEGLGHQPLTYSLSCLHSVLGMEPSRSVIIKTIETLFSNHRVPQPNIRRNSGSTAKKKEEESGEPDGSGTP